MKLDSIYINFLIKKFYNMSLFSFIYLVFFIYIISYFAFSFAFTIDVTFKLSILLLILLYMFYVYMNLKSIIIDYINNEVSQVLLISLLVVFFVNVIVYICLLI